MDKTHHNLPYKQLLVPPFRMETDVDRNQLPIYSKINPIVPPFLPYRSISRFPKFPGFDQQIQQLKNFENSKADEEGG